MPNKVGEVITKAEYYKNHKACPDCDNTTLQVSPVCVIEKKGVDFVDTHNTVKCKCGWRGKVDELIEPLTS